MRAPLAILGAAIVAAVATTPTSAFAQSPSLDDATIVAIFDAANTRDIETSSLAAKKGAQDDVRALGKNFANDHTQLRQQGRDLAKKLGVTPTPPKDTLGTHEQHEAMQQLQSLSGDDFDRAYLRHEVEYHKAVIAAVTGTLLPAIKNAELKAFVEKTAPAFQGHLAAAEKLAKKHGA